EEDRLASLNFGLIAIARLSFHKINELFVRTAPEKRALLQLARGWLLLPFVPHERPRETTLPTRVASFQREKI
ncbi:MAG: hypothetical protein ACAH88_18025, partial [Roseimicrobium sp.]